MRGLSQRSGWQWFWVARRQGQSDWTEATTAREAIRRAILLPPRKPPPWLSKAAADAEGQIRDASSTDSVEAAPEGESDGGRSD